MALFRKPQYSSMPARPDRPRDIASKCDQCKSILIRQELEKNLRVCPRCGYHFPLTAWQRIQYTLDEGSFCELNAGLEPVNPLGFPGYDDKLARARKDSGLAEAVITGRGLIEGEPAYVGVLAPEFMLGSMGSVVGEKLARMLDEAGAQGVPAIIFSASGGARMQESIFSLFQMAKTSAALARLHRKGVLYISVLTHPTTGGVTASFAMLGDINIGESGALIGFAGPRVIQQTIGQTLPAGFQRAEFLLEHGMLDMVVERKELRPVLARLLRLHRGGER
ncbi:MAG: acetyl-CoA carboxylase carboxyltransferase subunit beta [Firmicutes bacterium]|nr:acetyl-CoA carboxylase carboxyltransferase subunit beta [Bacillota bacterium]HOB35691.1 acetyl-CoA carboxylase, carboxyltransferase subunit beta [Bacillota bacterium]HPZ90403.1 acetyl-CoA carboxylase, carboxyltransferase subunit beta [Bacillota bacterium]HQE02501.1 acetyl-CoA carboxylase, carboxyltransferase subunit beta [Bacillota bacterium]